MSSEPRRLPLGPTQEGIWLYCRLNPETAAYNMPELFEVQGDFDEDLAAAAMAEVCRRHAALRTTFEDGPEGPRQVVWADPLPGMTASLDVPAADAGAEARRQAALPFDLAAGPLLRLTILRLSPGRQWLILTAHHLVCDGTSMGILVEELGQCYSSLARGVAWRPDGDAPAPFHDFASEQLAALAGGEMEEDQEYWREALRDCPSTTFPADRAAEAGITGATTVVRELPATLSRALHALARERSTTPFTALFATCQLLLARLNGEAEVAIGATISGRVDPRWRETVGMLANTAVIRAPIDLRGSFLDLLEAVGERTFDALDHQALPFSHVVRALGAQDRRGDRSLIRVMFAAAASGQLALGDLPCVQMDIASGFDPFDTTVIVEIGEDLIRLSWEFDRGLYAPETMARFADLYAALLTAAVADPWRPLWQLDWLPEAERARLAAFESGGPAVPAPETVAGAIERHARATPDAVAVVAERQAITYRRLWEESGRLAGALDAQDPEAGYAVGLCFDSGPGVVTGVLAALRAMRPFVPLDVAWPENLLAYVVEDARIGAIVADGATAPVAAALLGRSGRGGRPLLADDLGGAADLEPPGHLDGRDRSTWPAYVMYTSGSTGRPKGVMISHRSLDAFAAWTREAFAMHAGDRVLATHRFSFDMWLWEVLQALTAGGTLHLPRLASQRDVESMVATIDAEDVTVLNATPTQLGAALEVEGAATAFGRLRLLVSGGETLPADVAARALGFLAGDAVLINEYGPTETTVCTSIYPVSPAARAEWADAVPIGRPIAGTRFLVLDEWGGRVPVGVEGEICIAGIGVGLGYCGAARASAQKFQPDPEAAAGGLLYRSGDRGRWLASGEMAFLGRTDSQVKVRGYRIELEEVGEVLRRHPAVRDAVAAVLELAGDRRVVAWVVPEGAPSPSLAAELMDHARAEMPPFMVPWAVEPIEGPLPVGTTGKLNIKALPVPRRGMAEPEAAQAMTETERLVAEVWAEVLGLESVSPSGDFFDLGGHSMLATQVVGRLRQRLSASLPLRTLFDFPRLRDFAARVEAAPASPAAASVAPIAILPRRPVGD